MVLAMQQPPAALARPLALAQVQELALQAPVLQLTIYMLLRAACSPPKKCVDWQQVIAASAAVNTADLRLDVSAGAQYLQSWQLVRSAEQQQLLQWHPQTVSLTSGASSISMMPDDSSRM